MPIEDRIAAARKIDEMLRVVLHHGGFRLKYRITANPPANDVLGEKPEIVVEFAGPDGAALVERNGELLRAMEHVSLKILRLESDEHDKVSFDCMNFKAVRAQELKLAAEVAAERVRKTGTPYQFAPMSARERRMVHLAMREHSDLRTESSGEAERRFVVVYPRDYQGTVAAPPSREHRRRR
ncbi:MAG TPA: R3H domain-containing nucleic acid-binding protein [Terriglobales bacterium]|nr:R3H domain-containing nucleic acid-binding protein [Terriglobales bacterium]